jgi:hypothetical protein
LSAYRLAALQETQDLRDATSAQGCPLDRCADAPLREPSAQNVQGGRSRKYIGMPASGTNGERRRLRGVNDAARFACDGAILLFWRARLKAQAPPRKVLRIAARMLRDPLDAPRSSRLFGGLHTMKGGLI